MTGVHTWEVDRIVGAVRCYHCSAPAPDETSFRAIEQFRAAAEAERLHQAQKKGTGTQIAGRRR